MPEKLTGRELEAALACARGWKRADWSWGKADDWIDPETGSRHIGPLRYSSDLNAMREVEDELKRRGLERKYARALGDLLDFQCGPKPAKWSGPDLWFDFATAPAELRARAALRVLEAAR
jgi:hypothetical protein